MPEEHSTWVPVAPGAGGTSAEDTVEHAALPEWGTVDVTAPGQGVPVAGPVGVMTVPDTGLSYRFDDTGPLPAAGGGAALAADGSMSPEEDAPWPSHAVRRGIRMRVPTAVLLALLLAGGAFWGGAAVQKSRGSSTGAGGAAASRFRSAFAGAGAGGRSAAGASGARGGAGAFAGFGGASSAAATGQVTFIKGDTIYVTTSSGNIVTVDVTPSTKVTRNATASASALKPGDTVVVQGSTAKDGTVTASSVSATAQGVSTSGGGFGGFAGGGAGSGGGAGGSGGRGAAG